MKTILTARSGSGYEDIVEEKYHFPSTYLNQIEAGIGDQFIYYEPRRNSPLDSSVGGRQSYFAVARLGEITADPQRAGYYFVSVFDYLSFIHDVPFRIGSSYFESALKRTDGNTNRGAFGRAVRNLPDDEFETILRFGFNDATAVPAGYLLPVESNEFAEEQGEFIRPMVEITTSRPFRDRVFARKIQDAYQRTCAITGLKIINGGGRAEVQAAHIKPVAQSGPDSIGNGIALSGTIHWMFDRGLISIDSDYRILTVHSAIPEPIRKLINPDQKMSVPENLYLRPLEHYLRYHREHIFKG